jgi:hypothetical protein
LIYNPKFRGIIIEVTKQLQYRSRNLGEIIMAARSKTTKKPAADAPQDQVAIPSAVRPAAAPAAPAKPSAASLLAGLAGKAQTKKPKSSSESRPVLELRPDVQALYAEFAPAKELFDVLKARVESLKGELNPELFSAWCSLIWQKQTLPKNPNIEIKGENGTLDVKGMFIVTEKFKVNVPRAEEPEQSVIELLVKQGVGQKEAEELVNEEIDFTPQTSLRPFNELVNGHYEAEREFVEATAAEQAVGQKILEFVTTQLSAEEQELVLRNQPKTTVKKGFLQRVCKYASTEKQLEAIFQVVVPTPQNKGAKFGVNDTPVQKTARLVRYAEEALGKTSCDGDDDGDDDE